MLAEIPVPDLYSKPGEKPDISFPLDQPPIGVRRAYKLDEKKKFDGFQFCQSGPFQCPPYRSQSRFRQNSINITATY